MLYAETTVGKRISAFELKEQVLHSEKSNLEKQFYCPACREPVFFKNGERKLPHFSHYRSSCCQSFSEGETEAHLAGKIKLWEWCHLQGMEVEVEAWLPDLQQRPDLLLRLKNGRKIALEYQCSPIPSQQIQQRTKGYRSHGYEVFWICGKGYIPSQRLLDKHTVFLNWNAEEGLGLNCLDSSSGYLLLYRSFSYTSQNRLSIHAYSIPLAKLSFPDFEIIGRGGIPSGYKQKKLSEGYTKKGLPLTERLFLLHKKDPIHRSFLEQMYLRRHHIQMLPEFLFHFPVKEILYQTPSYIWKYYFLCWLEQKGAGATVSRQEITQFYFLLQEHRFLLLRPAPFVPTESFLVPLFGFVQTLTEEKGLTAVGTDLWLIVRNFFSTSSQ